MTLPVTALAAALCALMLIFMKFRVVGQRLATETRFGAGEDAKMKMVRGAHANLAENAPIALILMALLEMANAHHWTLTAIAALFLTGRAAHIIGMNQHHDGGPPLLRQVGVIATWLTMGALALWIVVLFVRVNL